MLWVGNRGALSRQNTKIIDKVHMKKCDFHGKIVHFIDVVTLCL